MRLSRKMISSSYTMSTMGELYKYAIIYKTLLTAKITAKYT